MRLKLDLHCQFPFLHSVRKLIGKSEGRIQESSYIKHEINGEFQSAFAPPKGE
jgi:hypothetical protein